MTQQKPGNRWLDNYSGGLLTANATMMASLFHEGFTYIVNDEKRPGSDTFHKKETWEHIFTRIEFTKVKAHNVFERHSGHILYTEQLHAYIKSEDRVIEGYFGEEAVVNSNGKMLLINRVASDKYFEEFTKALS